MNNVSVSRERFERWYVENAFDLEGAPLSSRDCDLQWKAWKAALAQPSEQPGDVGREAILRDGIGHALTMLRDLADEYDGDELPGDAHPVHKKAREIGHHLQGTLIQSDAALSPGAPVAFMCPVGCGCLWRDNKNGTWSLYGENSKSCDVCETLHTSKLLPVFASPPANDEWRAAIVKRLAELGLFAADEQDDPELAVSTLETIATSANDGVHICQDCHWFGRADETVHPPHDPERKHCPECHGIADAYSLDVLVEAFEQPANDEALCSLCNRPSDQMGSDSPGPDANPICPPCSASDEAVRLLARFRDLWETERGMLEKCVGTIDQIELACRDADAFLASQQEEKGNG